jgi:hypothetical protein
MSASENVKDIFTKVKDLNKEEQLSLLGRLVKLINKSEDLSTPQYRLTNLASLGSEVWVGTNIEDYLDGERQW